MAPPVRRSWACLTGRFRRWGVLALSRFPPLCARRSLLPSFRMQEQGIILIGESDRSLGQLEAETIGADFDQIATGNGQRTAHAPPIENHAVQALAICEVDLPFVPDQFGMIA